MWLKWLPWKYVVRQVAQAHGFIDPVKVLSHLHRFAQPSEVTEPVELLRAGVVFHARGLMNTKAIQHNLDWVWPYWVERQFNPSDVSFIPRAFSVSHVNLTHRNWTAIGLPNCNALPLVDPRGLVTPFFDGWSIDGWIVTENDRWLLPSKCRSCEQRLIFNEDDYAIETKATENNLALTSRVEAVIQNGQPHCQIRYTAEADSDSWLVVALRPYNPEGVSFIRELELTSERKQWDIDGKAMVFFQSAADGHAISDYHSGDVKLFLQAANEKTSLQDPVGMLTAAALFKLNEGRRELTLTVPLAEDEESKPLFAKGVKAESWQVAMENHCQLEHPDDQIKFLYESHLRTLILHSPFEVYAGPYTYKRFWFRDATYILHALLCIGRSERVERLLDHFKERQTVSGFFRSQEGEWDSNGEVLWILNRFCELTGVKPKKEWQDSIHRGAEWIESKRTSRDSSKLHAGLLPAGFSAEHLGTNDYYYWDDFWSVAGLNSAAEMMQAYDQEANAQKFRDYADDLMAVITGTLAKSDKTRDLPGMPASPYRRMDAGAIGSIVAGYPLQLWAPDDQRLLDTADFLMNNCFYDGGFFQDMIHSGINIYLTLHIAQVLLRAGREEFYSLFRTVMRHASPTGQWPEAVHPHTGGGCMGDGQHIWAAADWILMVRALFVREEKDHLVIASGIVKDWLQPGNHLSFGSTPTRFGNITVNIDVSGQEIRVTWDARWRKPPKKVILAMPGRTPQTLAPDQKGKGKMSLIEDKKVSR